MSKSEQHFSKEDFPRSPFSLSRNLRPEDFGQYGCFAENEVGTAMHEMRLVENSTDILTLVVGLTCVLGLLLLLAIFLYYRARRICCGEDPEKD